MSHDLYSETAGVNFIGGHTPIVKALNEIQPVSCLRFMALSKVAMKRHLHALPTDTPERGIEREMTAIYLGGIATQLSHAMTSFVDYMSNDAEPEDGLSPAFTRQLVALNSRRPFDATLDKIMVAAFGSLVEHKALAVVPQGPVTAYLARLPLLLQEDDTSRVDVVAQVLRTELPMAYNHRSIDGYYAYDIPDIRYSLQFAAFDYEA